MSRASRIVVVASLTAFALVAGACSLLIEDYPLTLTGPDASAPDAGTDASIDGSPLPAVCQNVHPPPKPVTPMAAGATYVVAVAGFTLPSDPIRGYDLDGICTCDSRDQSALHGAVACGPSASPPPETQCDPDGGIDNSLGKQVARFSVTTFTDGLARANEKILCGYGTVIIAITGYNGLADDDEVIVTLLSSNGLWDAHDGGESLVGDAAIPQLLLDAGPDAAPINCGSWTPGQSPYPARFDGTDLWTSPPGSTITTNNQKLPGLPILSGYVVNHTLTVDLSRTDAGVSLVLSSEIPLTFHSPVMTATIVPLDVQGRPTDAGPSSIAAIRLENALLAGRCNTHEMLSAFAPIPVGGDLPSCTDAQQWAIIYLGVCGGADLPDDPSQDTQMLPKCTALSTAFAFSATPATIGSDHNGLGLVDASLCDAAMTYCQ